MRIIRLMMFCQSWLRLVLCSCTFIFLADPTMNSRDSSDDMVEIADDSPMNLVTGLWGMNVHVPGQDIESGVSHLRVLRARSWNMQYTWFASILGGLCLFAILGAFATVSLLGILGMELMSSTNVSLLDRWLLLFALPNCICISTTVCPCSVLVLVPERYTCMTSSEPPEPGSHFYRLMTLLGGPSSRRGYL